MRVTIVHRIGVGHVGCRHGDRLDDNDGNNQTINTQNTRHDNGHNVFDDTSGMINAHVAYAQTGPPSSPGRAPATQDHAAGGAHVAAVIIINIVATKEQNKRVVVVRKQEEHYQPLGTHRKRRYSAGYFCRATYKPAAQDGHISAPCTTCDIFSNSAECRQEYKRQITRKTTNGLLFLFALCFLTLVVFASSLFVAVGMLARRLRLPGCVGRFSRS